jgi:hypothetical protein
MDMQSFKETIAKSTNWYTINITNGAGPVLTALLCPGLQFRKPTGEYINGLVATGAFSSVENIDGLAGSGGPVRIEFYNEFLQKVPSKILGLRLQTSDTSGAQMAQSIIFQPQSPFGNLDSFPVSIGNYKDDMSFNANIALIPVPAQVDNQTRVSIGVVPNSSLSITIYFGEFMNVASLL